MNGTTNTGWADPGIAGLQWQIIGTGDFDHAPNFQTDILWQNTTTGQLSLWLMSGAVPNSFPNFGTTNPVWQAVGTGHFNGDSNLDVLLQDKP